MYKKYGDVVATMTHTFAFYEHVFRDDIGSVWVAAWVNGKEGQSIGAYVHRDSGAVVLRDYASWWIDDDLYAMGIDPESDEATALVADWIVGAAEQGRRLFDSSVRSISSVMARTHTSRP